MRVCACIDLILAQLARKLFVCVIHLLSWVYGAAFSWLARSVDVTGFHILACFWVRLELTSRHLLLRVKINGVLGC